MPEESGEAALNSKKRLITSLLVIGMIAAAFAAIMLSKTAPASPDGGAGVADGLQGAGGTSITSVTNDATADYAAALESGKPIYLLFHSLTCEPCIEISGVADTVMPEYEGKITFVNAITDDPSAQSLAADFEFQYIPTSFFIGADGRVVDSFTGSMDAPAMRGFLDALLESR